MAHAMSSKLRLDLELNSTTGNQPSVTLKPCAFIARQPSDAVLAAPETYKDPRHPDTRYSSAQALTAFKMNYCNETVKDKL